MNNSIINKSEPYQETHNSCMNVFEKPTCDVCGRKCKTVIEIKREDSEESQTYCFLHGRTCAMEAMQIFFSQNPDEEYLCIRRLDYKPIGISSNSKNSKSNRKGLGLSLRYEIMRRDGFQCVLCGASGADANIEIDHILPVSKGGGNDKENLRTLCFKCNRGKSNKMENQ